VKLVDFIREAMDWPWSKAPEGYQIVGQFPSVYKKLYEHEQGSACWHDTKSFQFMWWFNRPGILKFLTETVTAGVDLIISVHPLLQHPVIEAFEEIFEGQKELFIPVVTVVTDLGSAHLSWFDPRVTMLFVPSDEIQQLALQYQVTRRNIHLCGLPVRKGFWSNASSPKRELQERLGLAATDSPEVVLLMGGGEGFGNLFQVAVKVGEKLWQMGRGQMVVICGRNEEMLKGLNEHPWPWTDQAEGFRPKTSFLGFVSNIDEYMSAADILVTKAGPGSIAEAMIKGLPVLLTAFVPGQEEGNITFVTANGAGEYVSDEEPDMIADKVAEWLEDPDKLHQMSKCALSLARPRAALDITRRICDSLLDLGVELREAGVELREAPTASSDAATTTVLKSAITDNGVEGAAPGVDLREAPAASSDSATT